MTRGQRSSIKSLPDAVRAQVDFMITEGRWTLDEIVDYLAQAEHPRSRSAVGRYKQKVDQVAAKLRESREITEALVRELGPAAADGKQGRLLTEILRKLAFDTLVKQMEAGEEAAALEPGDFFFLAKALKEMASANRLDQDFETKVRQQVHERAAATATEAVKAAGLSDEVAQQIAQKILGVGS
jgi:hypothetical protein